MKAMDSLLAFIRLFFMLFWELDEPGAFTAEEVWQAMQDQNTEITK